MILPTTADLEQKRLLAALGLKKKAGWKDEWSSTETLAWIVSHDTGVVSGVTAYQSMWSDKRSHAASLGALAHDFEQQDLVAAELELWSALKAGELIAWEARSSTRSSKVRRARWHQVDFSSDPALANRVLLSDDLWPRVFFSKQDVVRRWTKAVRAPLPPKLDVDEKELAAWIDKNPAGQSKTFDEAKAAFPDRRVRKNVVVRLVQERGGGTGGRPRKNHPA